MNRSMIMRKLVGIVVTTLVVGGVSTHAAEKQEFDAAKQEYEQSSRDETARVAYVTKLAQLKVQLLKVPNEQTDLKRAINSECQKHPVPQGR